MSKQNSLNPFEELEVNMVEKWLQKDTIRWVAGVLAGFFACVLAVLVAMILAQVLKGDLWFPLKHIATIVLGMQATEVGFQVVPVLVGFVICSMVATFWGFVFSHFVWTNKFFPLFGMGLTWGAFTWVFLWNLYPQSFQSVFSAQISSGAAFLPCITYGLGLISVGLFDSLLRKKSK